jgi:transposase InsO family protein
MKALAGEFTVKALCEALDVSRSGYYAWLGHDRTPRARANQQLAAEIKRLFVANDGNYGSPRMTQALLQQQQRCNRKRVERLMREEGLSARTRKRFKVQTTDSDHDHPVAPNLLPQRSVTRPNQVWVVDVTYIRTGEGWLYLAGVMDLYSRRIVGWAMEDHMETSLVLAALGMARQRRQPGRGLLHHSDRGVQYASQPYRQTLRNFAMEASMSRKGNCYDNATMESFWGTLKTELVYRTDYPTREGAKRSIFAWIETYYNRKRLHSSLGYKSPVDFENQLN